LISGMLTLIATTPNIVVHEELKGAGFDGFGFFSFAPVGIAVLAVAVIYVLFIGRRLLSDKTTHSSDASKMRSIDELFDDFRLDRNYGGVRIVESSLLIGRTIAEVDLEKNYGLQLLAVMRPEARGKGHVHFPVPDMHLQAGDILLMVGKEEEKERLIRAESLAPYQASIQQRQRWLWEIGAATLMIHPESSLLGQTAEGANLNSRYNLQVLGMRRDREALADYANTPLASADILLVAGPWSSIQRLQSDKHEVIVLETPSEKSEIVPSYRKLPVALTILASMVLLTLFDIVPLVAAVIMAALAAVFTRCLTIEDAYRSIHWPSLVLIGGMLPLADALDATGGTRMIVDALLAAAGESSPYVMLSVIFFLTAALGLVLSNTASAVLVAPIAIYAASALGVSPYPFAVAVLIAASAAYSTPVSTPVVTLVVEPGKYGFADFLKVGVPLLFLTYLATLLVAPLIFPFYPS
jgi:di/tricarboxylate transporter